MSESLGAGRRFLKGKVIAENLSAAKEVEIEVQKHIGEGGYGVASEAKITISNETGDKARSVPLVFKEMHTKEHFDKMHAPNERFAEDFYARQGLEYTPPPPYYPEEAAEHAFQMHTLAKKAELAVIPTFRIVRDKTGILMTDLRRMFPGVTQGFSSYDLWQKRNVIPPMERIRDIPGFITGLLNEGKKAADAHLQIAHSDAYFLLPDTKTGDVHYVAFDFDKFFLKPEMPHDDLLRTNINSLAKLAIEYIRSQPVGSRERKKEELKIMEESLLAYLKKHLGFVDYRLQALSDFPKPLGVRMNLWWEGEAKRDSRVQWKLRRFWEAIFKKNYR